MSRRPNHAEFLPAAEAIASRRHSPAATLLLLLVAAFCAVALTWAALFEVEEATVAAGQVRPDGRVKVVNHPEGGRVAAVLVREGQMVRQGETLLRLDAESLGAEVARLRGHWLALSAEAARLQAETAGQPVVTMPVAVLRERPDLAAMHGDLFRARHEALAARRDGADRQVEQRRAEIGGLRAQIAGQRAGLDILRKQVASLGELAGKGYFPWLRFQTVQRDLSDREGELARAEQALRGALAALSEAEIRRQQVDEDALSAALAELNRATAERDALALALAQQDGRLRHMEVTAPADGVVQGLAVNGPGQAIRPNEPILHIVPVSDSLVVEARVANRDIGHVAIGQPAKVKVRTWEAIRYGALDGVVEQIGADAVTDPRTGAAWYSVIIRTDRTWLGPAPGERPVSIGMLVDVDLKTGSRTILDYLTERALATADRAFRER